MATDNTPKRLADDDLDRLVAAARRGLPFEGQDYDDVEALVAEVCRLRSEIAVSNVVHSREVGVLLADRDRLADAIRQECREVNRGRTDRRSAMARLKHIADADR